jgi:hypothetical protein
MGFRYRRSPGVAIAAVCGCALVSLYLFQRAAWRDCATHDQYSPERFVARYEALAPLLPREAVTGFVLDESHVDTKRLHPGARLFLAQYAVSPRRLTQEAAARWVVVDSDHPELVPDVAAKSHWILLADLRNGVRLYRTNLKE